MWWLDFVVGKACGDDVHRDVGGAAGVAEVGVADLRGLEFGAGRVEVIPAFDEDPAGTTGEDGASPVGRVTVEGGLVAAVGFPASEFESQAAVLFDICDVHGGVGVVVARLRSVS